MPRPRGHPDHVAGSQLAFVAVPHGAFEDQGHALQTCVWKGAADLATAPHLEAVVHQKHEGVAGCERVRVYELDRHVALADEPGFGRPRGVVANEGEAVGRGRKCHGWVRAFALAEPDRSPLPLAPATTTLEYPNALAASDPSGC